MITTPGQVLDLACGGGRHARFLLAAAHAVTLVDRDLSGVRDLSGTAGATLLEHDLEDGSDWPFAGGSFDAVVVVNYLFRPRFDTVLDCVGPGGLLIYETFADGNQAFGRPRNPDFLLQPGELLDRTMGQLRILAYEDLVIETPRKAAVQRIAAVRDR